MSDASPILGLPYILPSQAQKHVTHNEAIRLLDVLVQLAVADRGRTTAPTDPAAGDRHIVGPGANGTWAGRDGQIAVWEATGWAFLAPLPGWRAAVLDEARTVVWDGAGWVSAADLPQSFPRLGVAATADDTNRLAVGSPASLFSHAGSGGHQMKLNKALPADTASMLFQTGFSGRAEVGLAGSDGLSVKVSADGTAWLDALAADPASGRMRLPGGLSLPDGSAAAPALAFQDDPDTGLRRPAADQIGMVAGAVQRATLSSAAFQIDVPVTGTAVQSSVTDTTAGRLALVGAFGLGQTGLLPALGDVNSTSTATGWWYYNSGTTNYASLPAAAQGNGLMRVERRAGDTLVQTVHLMNLSGGVWVRGYAASTWGPWRMLYTQATALGTVSQSGGVPTGAIIETGSGANGSYTRLAGGTQFCAISINETDTAWSTASGSIYVRASVLAWTYPAAFSASPVMSATVRRATLSGGGANINSISTTGCDCTPWAAVSVAASNSKFVHLTAIGRWY